MKCVTLGAPDRLKRRTASSIKRSALVTRPEAALYIQPPILATSVAAQITRKADWRNGAQGDKAGEAAIAVEAVSLIASRRRLMREPAAGLGGGEQFGQRRVDGGRLFAGDGVTGSRNDAERRRRHRALE